MNCPFLHTGNRVYDHAFRIAVGDVARNIQPSGTGLLHGEQPVLLAGLKYMAWTRDAAINVWNGFSLLDATVARNTLLGELVRRDGRLLMRGQYWDAVIWVVGAWWHYLYTGDREFLSVALQATRDWLSECEHEEFDPVDGLFRGPACYGDGVSAYPDRYAYAGSDILHWPQACPDQRSPVGVGLPMKALSTNCLYYQAYRLADRMAGELGVPLRPDDAAKADALKTAIHRQFWQADRQLYRYLVDPFGGCDRQEGLGLAFAVLFGVADPACTSALMERVHTDPAGIPCLWPSYDRYGARVPGGVGRHSGTVWPHVQGFWAHAALTAGRMDRFMHEFSRLAEHIFRDNQCAEIYHPRTGTPYGGLQELDIRTPEDWHSWCIVGQVGQATTGNPVYEWYSLPSNTWSATAYLRMVMLGLAGLDFRPDGIRFAPRLPAGWPGLRLSGLPYRQAMLDLHITGCGCNVTACTINGRSALPELPATATGPHRVELSLGD